MLYYFYFIENSSIKYLNNQWNIVIKLYLQIDWIWNAKKLF